MISNEARVAVVNTAIGFVFSLRIAISQTKIAKPIINRLALTRDPRPTVIPAKNKQLLDLVWLNFIENQVSNAIRNIARFSDNK